MEPEGLDHQRGTLDAIQERVHREVIMILAEEQNGVDVTAGATLQDHVAAWAVGPAGVGTDSNPG